MEKDKLVFHYLKEERRYELITKSGELVSDLVAKFIKQHEASDVVILNDADYKVVKDHRTEINGLLDEIESARKQTIAVVINPLVNACKPLEKSLKEASASLKEKLDAYKPKDKPKTTSIITIEYPIGSEEISKVKTYLNRVKIAYKEEEK